MKIRPIKTPQDYRRVLAEIDRLLDAPEGSEDADTLELLSMLVETYEDREVPIPASDPIEAIKFWMDQNNLSPHDLEPFLGDLEKVTEVLSRKRPLTLAMIRNLSLKLGIPSGLLIPPYHLEKAA